MNKMFFYYGIVDSITAAVRKKLLASSVYGGIY